MNWFSLAADGSADGHDYVDLGLPSSTLWATCNVGANAPEEHGDYFAWGETMPKTVYGLENYKYCKGDEKQLTKYNVKSEYGYHGFADGRTTLLSDDDAATANWGCGWHTPTKEQWRELLDNTTHQWTARNGVEGRLFISKKNGKSLFLPATGTRSDDGLYYAGSNGNYWSSSLSTYYPSRAWSFYFPSDNYGMYYDGYRRDGGLSVRPVRSAR